MDPKEPLRAVLIDPAKESVREVKIKHAGSGYEIAKTIGGRPETAIRFGDHAFPLWANGHTLLVDTEGLRRNYRHHFRFKFGIIPVLHDWQWLAGRGLIVRGVSEAPADHSCELNFFKDSIEFLHGKNPTNTRGKIQAWAE